MIEGVEPKIMTSSGLTTQVKLIEPKILNYQDYRDFLKDWVVFQKSNKSSQNLTKLSKKLNVSKTAITLVLQKKRHFSLSLFWILFKNVIALDHLDFSYALVLFFKQTVVQSDNVVEIDKWLSEISSAKRFWIQDNKSNSGAWDFVGLEAFVLQILTCLKNSPQSRDDVKELLLPCIFELIESADIEDILKKPKDNQTYAVKNVVTQDNFFSGKSAHFDSSKILTQVFFSSVHQFELYNQFSHTMAVSKQEAIQIADLIKEFRTKTYEIFEKSTNSEVVLYMSNVLFNLTKIPDSMRTKDI